MTKDYAVAAIIGFITALLAVPVLKNLDIELPFGNFWILAIIPVLWVAGIWLGAFLSRWIGFMRQFARFAVAGFLAAAIDFGILNLLMHITGLVSGLPFTLFKAASFVVAATNSYFVNKFWAFRQVQDFNIVQIPDQKTSLKEYSQFLVVSAIGITINVGVASLVVNAVGPQFGIEPKVWANLGAVAGAAIGLIWNFIGFKLIVFKV